MSDMNQFRSKIYRFVVRQKWTVTTTGNNHELYLPWLLGNQTYKQKQLSLSIAPQVANTSTLSVTIDLYFRSEPI
jgi:hypothetical protein